MSNLKELEKKYEELGKEIDGLLEEIERLKGKEASECADSNIFLLSTEEYKKYKDKIPHINCGWWLRSPGYYSQTAVVISGGGIVQYAGYSVHLSNFGVRPVLRCLPNFLGQWRFADTNDRIFRCGMTWIKIDENLYIAEVPIAFRRFDEKDNNYQTSEIRQFLLNWCKERVNW